MDDLIHSAKSKLRPVCSSVYPFKKVHLKLAPPRLLLCTYGKSKVRQGRLCE